MRRDSLAVAVLLVMALANRSSFCEEKSKEQSLDREFPGECPGEGGCQFGIWTAQAPIVVYSKRSTDSPVLFRLAKGDKVTGVSSVLVVHKVGSCTAKEGASITRLTGSDTPIPAGTKLPLYFYEGEGNVHVDFKGELASACCEDVQITCEISPITDLWLQVRSQSGRAGWTNQRDAFSGTSQYD